MRIGKLEINFNTWAGSNGRMKSIRREPGHWQLNVDIVHPIINLGRDYSFLDMKLKGNSFDFEFGTYFSFSIANKRTGCANDEYDLDFAIFGFGMNFELLKDIHTFFDNDVKIKVKN